jgi:type IV secretory pathway VirB2 component (pilin)
MAQTAETVTQAVDATIAVVGHKMAQVGGWGAFLSWLVSERGVAMAGIVIGVIGLGIQWWYRRKQDRREQAEHVARMGMYANE